MKLSDVVVLDRQFARSVNLARDNTEISVLSNYQITAKAQEVLGRFIAALGDENVSAWSLVGPYGMGKSAFLNFLLSIAGPASCKLTNTALHKLQLVNEALYQQFLEKKEQITGQKGFFRIPVIASFEPVNSTLLRGLHTAVSQSQLVNKDAICTKINKQIESPSVESETLFQSFQEIAEAAGTPLVIIIDELGKNLEYLSYYYHDGDLFILQQLAEMDNVYLWVSLHQSFQEYMPGFSIVQQQEWNKVQGRFEEISFVESAKQMLHLIKTIVGQQGTNDMPCRIEKWAIQVKKTLEPIDSVGKEYFTDVKTIKALYPFHPVTSLALVELCRKYAQNERTLTSYLCSGHEFALPAKLEQVEISNNGLLPAIGPDYLYDYFFQLGNTTLAHTPKAQRWLEIYDIIQTSGQHTEEESIILRNIGVLNLLSGYLGLKASFEAISSIMKYAHGWPISKTKAMLNSLGRRGIIFKREYSSEFRLWEGSDFDVNGAIAKEKAKLSLGWLEKIMEQHLPLSPIIASRHSLKTGTLRKFERRWVDYESLSDDQFVPYPGLDGLLLYCFGTAKELDIMPPQKCNDGRPLMLIYAPIKETLSEMALEVIACQYVLDKYPQMSYDKVARKEVNFRYQLARKRFREYSERAFTPTKEGLIYYVGQEKKLLCSRRKLSEKISALCDSYYIDAPVIGNEIISGEKLSSIATRARRELVEAMASRADEENLGFTGWGPEVAIYQSLLHAKGLHKQDPETGHWYLTLGDDPKLSKLWVALDRMLVNADGNGITVKDMVKKLRQPPFGLRQGPSLLYISLYLLVKAEDLIVFCEKAYQPYLSAADMALLLKRPDLFTVKTFVADEAHQEIFSVYKTVFETAEIKVDANLRNATMLGVVGPLMKFIDELPNYSKRTCSISKKAQRVRTAVSNAVDPLRFLFEELPSALGIDTINTDISFQSWELESNLRSVLVELGGAFNELKQKIVKVFLEKFHSDSLEQLYASQNPKGQQLLAFCDSTELRPVLQAMARKEEDLLTWVQGIAGAVLKKPVDVWTDGDFRTFRIRLVDYIDRIEQLAVLAKASAPESNVHVISVMKPGGDVRRQVIRTDDSDQDVRDKVMKILKLPQNKRQAVLAALVQNIIVGGDDNG